MASRKRNTRRPLTELCLEAKEAAKSDLRSLSSGDKIRFGQELVWFGCTCKQFRNSNENCQ